MKDSLKKELWDNNDTVLGPDFQLQPDFFDFPYDSFDMNRFIIKVENRDKLISMMINGTGPGKPSVFYIGWHNFVPMQNTL